ncbi:thiamine pyrophosphate-dependent enzyme [Pontiella sulfatireligans]|uniref:2-oxoglutarate oxidoreductase subunit KorB n=1 Tax=Pontiella sulfatireligans TaxID=2750658 RepID=A0A6C2UNH0_9BACT|nr:thiamine pyrophosphate-dependent enzyme [Pontiella sulfatireligans]VGO21609.1 2-oxoglutarate oxidoreductase subunit KorB [Pontiella sulfatireligans]
MEGLKEYLTRQDFVSSSEVRWCPGCGDYAVLNSVQNVLPQLGLPKEKFVFVSGIGCSSRFPYYLDTYGFHSIHGRAPTIATGVKVANPELSVWVVTGDGDGLSIGGNHLVHALRRNLDMNIILLNNRIYGLTKGQYSPTSRKGQITKTSPYGVLEEPLDPLRIALASEATFVGRAVDTDPKHITEVLVAGAEHKGTAFVEILQSCVIFNKNAWTEVSDRSCREDRLLYLEQGKPLIFGEKRNKGIILKGTKPVVVTIGEQGIKKKDLVVHDRHREDPVYAAMLTKMDYPDYPLPVGIFHAMEKPVYEVELVKQIKEVTALKGRRNLQGLLRGSEYWTVSNKGKTIKRSTGISSLANDESKVMDERIHALLKSTDPLTASLKNTIGKIFYDYDYKRSKMLSPRDSIASAIALFKAAKIECILVGDAKRLYGILSERDIIQNVVLTSVDRDRMPISSIMRPVYEIMDESNSIGDVINILSISGHRHVPIRLKDGGFGLVTIRQILRFIHDTVEQVEKKESEDK